MSLYRSIDIEIIQVFKLLTHYLYYYFYFQENNRKEGKSTIVRVEWFSRGTLENAEANMPHSLEIPGMTCCGIPTKSLLLIVI